MTDAEGRRRSPVHGSEMFHRALVQMPGFLERFAKDVPPSYMRKHGLRCVCGESVEFDAEAVLYPCPGCDRTFLRTQTKGASGLPATGRVTRVRVARFQPAEPEGPCECADRRLLYEARDGSVACANCDGTVAMAVAA